MKKLINSKATLSLVSVVWSLILFSGCSYQSEDVSKVISDEPFAVALSGDLTDDEIASLMHMVEEEKLALDVYTQMLELYELKIFENIRESESRHVDAVCRLFENYDLTNPIEGNPPGVFTDQEMQTLYDNFIIQGSSSILGAKEVGIAIEEIDIADLTAYLDQVVVSKDIEKVYSNLLSGSQNHLNAFLAEIN